MGIIVGDASDRFRLYVKLTDPFIEFCPKCQELSMILGIFHRYKKIVS